MKQIVLSSDDKYDYVLLQSDDDEIIELRLLILTYGNSQEETFRNTHKLYNIIAFGKGYEVTEQQARKYIPSGNHSDGRNQQMYKCVIPYNKEHPFLSHHDAKSAWYCALESLDFPMYAILVRVPRVPPVNYGTDTNSNPEVPSGSETL